MSSRLLERGAPLFLLLELRPGWLTQCHQLFLQVLKASLGSLEAEPFNKTLTQLQTFNERKDPPSHGTSLSPRDHESSHVHRDQPEIPTGTVTHRGSWGL